MDSIMSGRILESVPWFMLAPAVLPTMALHCHCESPWDWRGLRIIVKTFVLVHTWNDPRTPKCLWTIYENLYLEEGAVGGGSWGKVRRGLLNSDPCTGTEGTSSSCGQGETAEGAPDKLMQAPGERGLPKEYRAQRGRAGRRMDRINQEAGNV